METYEITDRELHRDGVTDFRALYQGDLFRDKEILATKRFEYRLATVVVTEDKYPRIWKVSIV